MLLPALWWGLWSQPPSKKVCSTQGARMLLHALWQGPWAQPFRHRVHSTQVDGLCATTHPLAGTVGTAT